MSTRPRSRRHVGGVQSEEESTAAFERLEGYQRDTGHTFWVVERKRDGVLLGFCGLKLANVPGTPVHGEVEIGWRLRADAWGQGYAKEAAQASLDWAWANLDCDRVVSFTIPANERELGADGAARDDPPAGPRLCPSATSRPTIRLVSISPTRSHGRALTHRTSGRASVRGGEGRWSRSPTRWNRSRDLRERGSSRRSSSARSCCSWSSR